MRGRIVDVFIEEFERTIEWETFHRTPNIEEPAYLVEQDDGSEFILSYNELTHADDQDQPVIQDQPGTRMNDKKHTY